MATGSLGCLHAYLFHGCRWDEGWAGFGNRIHRADFKRLAALGPPIILESCETRTRIGPSRIVMRFEFRFEQRGELVYREDQSAMLVKGKALDGGADGFSGRDVDSRMGLRDADSLGSRRLRGSSRQIA